MKPDRLHVLTLSVILAGGIWLLAQHLMGSNLTNPEWCLFRSATGIPCPSCGTTRSVLALMRGQLPQALLLNPLGVIMAGAMLLFPPWILYDRIRGQNTFLRFYNHIEKIFRKRIILVPTLLLLIINWIWNLIKFLPTAATP